MARRTKETGPRGPAGLKVLFVAGFGPIVEDPVVSRTLYQRDLGIPFEEAPGGYLSTESLEGVKHFALWPLAQAAESCFGTPHWPTSVPRPHAWVEFDVEDIGSATRALEAAGYRLLVQARREPWGQTVTRFLSPEGILTAVTHTPALRTSA